MLLSLKIVRSKVTGRRASPPIGEMDAMEHSRAVNLWVALGAFTFPLLFFVSAPYGKLVRDGWGGQIDGRLGWFLQEIPSPVTLTLAYLYGAGVFTHDGAPSAPHPPLVLACLAAWWIHYLNRAVYYPLVRRMSNTTVPVVLMAVCFNLVNGTLVGTELAHGSAHLANPDLATVALGAAMFAAGAWVNVASDAILRGLRKSPKDRKHYVPRGGLFEMVACPHYLGECVEWTGFAVATRTRGGWAFAFWTFANLMPRAVAYREWYRGKFKSEYPASVWAMIPYVW